MAKHGVCLHPKKQELPFFNWLGLLVGLLIRDLSTDPRKGDTLDGLMFVVLSKTLGVFLVPSNLIIASGALGLGLIF
jgi:hypothetical protein